MVNQSNDERGAVGGRVWHPLWVPPGDPQSFAIFRCIAYRPPLTSPGSDSTGCRKAILMTTKHLVPQDIADVYEVHEWRNATGVLATAHAEEWADVQYALRHFTLLRSEILHPGGRKSRIANRFDGLLIGRGWIEKQFDTSITIDDVERSSPTHKVDCYKNAVALEVEWNNKTEFYDRDLNNFRLLYELRAIDVGLIVTRSSHLQRIFIELGRGNSYGASTTHIDKLLPRLEGGSGGGCPVLVFGITERLYRADAVAPEVADAPDRGDAGVEQPE
jgi:restriction endonuclease BglII